MSDAQGATRADLPRWAVWTLAFVANVIAGLVYLLAFDTWAQAAFFHGIAVATLLTVVAYDMEFRRTEVCAEGRGTTQPDLERHELLTSAGSPSRQEGGRHG